ncbi:hypothetical protein PENTCL1PPCAC_30862 [Pristionchus entomophagus]|uniref:Uncharacterized protein n=1 Tax=Pristionchus entomophagus TaxID=358040 RepID=A0AAV5UPT8_9BILA|nr:hypothetical protein PENTCL1PPCAC_30862 [Pristionchus entomophagus]
MMPFPSLYYPPQTPQMTVDGATLFPQMVASPLMYSCPQYFPPTPSIDTSYSNGGYHQTAAPAAGGGGVCSPSPVPLMSQQLQQPHHYPPLVAPRHDNCSQQQMQQGGGGGEEQSAEMGQSEMGAMPKQAETSIQTFE